MSKHRRTMEAMVALAEQHWHGFAGQNAAQHICARLGRKMTEPEALAAYLGFVKGACAMLCFTVDVTPSILEALDWMSKDLKHRVDEAQLGGGYSPELTAAWQLVMDLKAGKIACYYVTDAGPQPEPEPEKENEDESVVG
jgi:hypothetical protein